MAGRYDNHVRKLRLDRRLTQAELAHKAGLSHQQLSMIETGQARDWTRRHGARLAEALGCRIVDLMPGGADAPPLAQEAFEILVTLPEDELLAHLTILRRRGARDS